MPKPNILVVDADTAHLNNIFVLLHTHTDSHICCANSVDIALRIFQKKKITLVLLDWKTITSTEVDFFKHFKSFQEHQTFQTLIWAEKDTFRLNEPLIKVYAKESILKPIDSKDLLQFAEKNLPATTTKTHIPPALALPFDQKTEDFTLPQAKNGLDELEKEIVKQKIMLQSEKDHIFEERNKLLLFRKKILKEWKKLEREKQDLQQQQETFTKEENLFFEEQIRLQQQAEQLQMDKQSLVQEKSYLEEMRKVLDREKLLWEEEKKPLSKKK